MIHGAVVVLERLPRLRVYDNTAFGDPLYVCDSPDDTRVFVLGGEFAAVGIVSVRVDYLIGGGGGRGCYGFGHL
jgi:hypothetical protein